MIQEEVGAAQIPVGSRQKISGRLFEVKWPNLSLFIFSLEASSNSYLGKHAPTVARAMPALKNS